MKVWGYPCLPVGLLEFMQYVSIYHGGGIYQERIQKSQTGGPSELLTLAPWSKVEEWRPDNPPPLAVNLAPL